MNQYNMLTYRVHNSTEKKKKKAAKFYSLVYNKEGLSYSLSAKQTVYLKGFLLAGVI